MNWGTIDWSRLDIEHVLTATQDTLLMTFFSGIIGILIGLPLGIYLFLSSDKQLLQNKPVYSILSVVVNILRSIPFIILLIAMMPITKLIMGTTIGIQGAIPALAAAAFPFFARLVENVLRDLDPGISEASRAMGATARQTIFYVLLPEAKTGILAASVVTIISLLGYTAMAGVIGAGGLGDLALVFGYQRYQAETMIVTVVILVILVQLIQTLGDRLVKHFSRK